MSQPPTVTRPDTPFMDAVEQVLARLDQTIPQDFQGTVIAYLVGGVAVHVYTNWRTSQDIDATFSHRILVPRSIVVTYDDAGERRTVRLDPNYTDAIALLHPNWQDEAIPFERVGRIEMRVISPTDLAVAKIGRFQGNDIADIDQLARHGWIDADTVERRCLEALEYYVGGTEFIRHNIRDAVEMIREWQEINQD